MENPATYDSHTTSVKVGYAASITTIYYITSLNLRRDSTENNKDTENDGNAVLQWSHL